MIAWTNKMPPPSIKMNLVLPAHFTEMIKNWVSGLSHTGHQWATASLIFAQLLENVIAMKVILVIFIIPTISTLAGLGGAGLLDNQLDGYSVG